MPSLTRLVLHILLTKSHTQQPHIFITILTRLSLISISSTHLKNMSNFGVTQRPSSISPSSTPQMETPRKPKAKSLNNIKLAFPFGLPATPEAAATRIIKNLSHFSLFYVLVLWVGLSISLVPERKFSLLLLMATTIIANQYLIMLHLMPNSICINKGLDKTLVLVPVAIVTTVGLILTQAAVHLFATLGIGVPVILVHAVLWRDGGFVNEEASAPGELAPLVDTVQPV